MTIVWKAVVSVAGAAVLAAPLHAAKYRGAVHAVTAHGAGATVTLRYRHYRPYGRNMMLYRTDDVSLTIARSGSAPERYDARSLRLMDPTLFNDPGRMSCGAGAPLTVLRHYAVVEGVVNSKGCMRYARVIDLARPRGGVLPSYPIDHAAGHPDVPQAPAFTPVRVVRLTAVDRFTIPEDTRNRIGPSPWTLAVVRGTDRVGGPVEIVLEEPGDDLPRVGEEVAIGRLEPDAFGVNGIVFRLSPEHERAYASTQTPEPDSLIRAHRYNAWFITAERYADRGRFADAADAFAKALDLMDDPQLHAAEARSLARYRAIVADLRTGKITQAEARRRWFGATKN
jgi:hypothetical protein